jgi:hypothetical protein
MGQSGMDNPEKTDGAISNGQSRETLAKLATQDEEKENKKKHNITQKTKKMSNTDPTKN